MPCQVTYTPQPIAKVIQMPFVYPASGISSFITHCGPPDYPRLIVEIGPGRGDFLFHLAETNPDSAVVGIEIKRKRVDRLIRRVEKRGLKNICVIQDDAQCALPRFFKDSSVDAIHINFPDPWPKRRHAKNRTVCARFLSECRRTLRIEGTLSIVTDSKSYADEITKASRSIDGFSSIEADPDASYSVYPTLFATKWEALGRYFFICRYRRTG